MISHQVHNQDPFLPAKEAHQHVAPSLTVKDLSDFLRDLGRVLKNPRAGNPVLGDTLIELGIVLRRYSQSSIDEVLSGLTFRSVHRKAKKSNRLSQLQHLDVASLDLETVREMLGNPALSKADLVRLALERFGIPRSRLERQDREAALEAIKAALSNTEALDIISQEARREGARRSR